MSQPESTTRAMYLRPSVWLVYALLFAIAIPWYWPDKELPVVFGVPLWAAISIVASGFISVFTAWLLMCHWPSDEEDE